MMQIVGAAATNISFRSLRDIIYLASGHINAADMKFMQTLNDAYGLSRHIPGDGIVRRAERIAAGIASSHSGAQCRAGLPGSVARRPTSSTASACPAGCILDGTLRSCSPYRRSACGRS